MSTFLKDFPTIRAFAQALASRKFSAHEATTALLQEIKTNQALNAFVDVQPELSLAQARNADNQISHGTGALLVGTPLAHKDIFVTEGWRTTAGSKMLADYVSPFNATVINALYEAGTVSLGKVSCDEFAMGSGNEHAATGPVLNPWDPEVVPGGSSGGSAAAVAAGLVLGATGTDTGGSVRQPAALCGVCGIKPTYGVASRFGMIAYASSLDQAGVLATNAEDLAWLLDAISGFDEHDATSIQVCQGVANAPGRILNDYQKHVDAYTGNKPLAGLRIGVPKEYFGDGLDNHVAAAIEAAIAQFEAMGATRADISLPNTAYAIPAYYVIAPAEASSNLARYDAVRYGHRTAQYTDLQDMTARSRSEGFGDEVRKRIMIGTYVLSHGYYDAYYLQAQRVRRLIAQGFQSALTHECDVILGPVTPTVAPAIGSVTKDATAEWLGDIYTLSVNLAGLPGMSIPCGFAPGHRGQPLPVGLQVIGNYFDEGRMLAIAHAYQQVTDWHTRRPGGAA
ncbi:MAG: Asp-tRNA(Asn)/Glu-tRNA(Gln) amidotransferase subunit GatA [Burkholderiaceae bacterium]|nr:Asp-tRNA(Asn)/Glu-tRNA(Gln) amidotransferase subunit GatA [Burkholderiaceae bacterium]MCD8517812.1 Asp-tRNA(Asn)/Glu-tRNA(Gln) amidotransferase subunit GatA [Burkholderiaceae bacterium]MCD8537230.1 Asp-tRNA(Asn)/Glu-tRNA(Gln) amidotransferase subunit GatA [Burkholderiaceae bacterium]MCD8564646.1 Asp-tRNA(Asn)/Glu-tRNA(Gln) amidotransferase subunit GatA [Burkholderiaceae bacterium]